jgi:Mg2+-importing ATPase
MNEQIIFCATNSTKLILQALNTSFTGLSEQAIKEHRNLYGNNKIVHGKKLSLTKRIANAFINPFTAILFCLAIVSIFTDIIIQWFLYLALCVLFKKAVPVMQPKNFYL